MKHLTLIVHTDVQQALTDRLRDLDKVSGFTLSHVEGHGTEVEGDPFLAARDEVVGHVPRIQADILLDDEDVESVLASLRSTGFGLEGQSLYWVTAVAQSGRL